MKDIDRPREPDHYEPNLNGLRWMIVGLIISVLLGLYALILWCGR